MDIQTPALILMKFPKPSKEGFGAGLTPTSSTPGPKTLKAKGHILENCLRNKSCSAGCKVTRAATSTSASIL